MELENSSPYQQVPAIRPYPETTPSSTHDPLQLPENPSWYYPPIYVFVSPMASIPQASTPTSCAHLYPPPYAPQALPTSCVSFLPPAQYWVRGTDHSAPRYAAFSIPLSTSSLLGPNTLLNTLFSNTLSLRSSLNVSDQVSHPYKTTENTWIYMGKQC